MVQDSEDEIKEISKDSVKDDLMGLPVEPTGQNVFGDFKIPYLHTYIFKGNYALYSAPINFEDQFVFKTTDTMRSLFLKETTC